MTMNPDAPHEETKPDDDVARRLALLRTREVRIDVVQSVMHRIAAEHPRVRLRLWWWHRSPCSVSWFSARFLSRPTRSRQRRAGSRWSLRARSLRPANRERHRTSE